MATSARASFLEACERARAESIQHKCTQHVNAYVRMDSTMSEPDVTFSVSDWYASGSTVRTYTNGRDEG